MSYPEFNRPPRRPVGARRLPPVPGSTYGDDPEFDKLFTAATDTFRTTAKLAAAWLIFWALFALAVLGIVGYAVYQHFN